MKFMYLLKFGWFLWNEGIYCDEVKRNKERKMSS